MRMDGVSRIQRLEGLGVNPEAASALASATGVTDKMFASILGVNARTVREHRKARKKFKGDLATRIYQYYRVYRRAYDALGGEENVRDWLGDPQLALGMQRPRDLLRSPLGVDEVLNLLGAIEHGVYM